MLIRFLVIVSLACVLLSKASAQGLSAERGATVFQAQCVRCHIPIEINGRLQNDWPGRSAQELFQRISLTMPAENPGSLNNQQYLDLTAFLLEMARIDLPDNATDAMLASIQIDPPTMERVRGD